MSKEDKQKLIDMITFYGPEKIVQVVETVCLEKLTDNFLRTGTVESKWNSTYDKLVGK